MSKKRNKINNVPDISISGNDSRFMSNVIKKININQTRSREHKTKGSETINGVTNNQFVMAH